MELTARDLFIKNRIDYNDPKARFANSFNYVHQLQNLFYCLTGEELEIKF